MPDDQKVKETSKRRKDWERNQYAIRHALLGFAKKHKRLPSHVEISEETGISQETISKHMNNFDFEKLHRYTRTKLAPLVDDVMFAMFIESTKGNSSAAKLFLQYCQWVERMEHTGPDGGPIPLLTGIAADKLEVESADPGPDDSVDENQQP